MKKSFTILSILVISVLAFVGCEDRPDVYKFPADEYVYDIPDVPVTKDYVVGVPYDTKFRDPLNHVWWDTGKKAHQLYTGTPVLGEYDLRNDADVLRQHLDWGKEAGIDFFVLSWGGHGINDTILMNWEKLYQQDNARPKVVIRFDPGYRFGKGKDTLQLNQHHMDSLRRDLDSLYANVMTHDFAYKKADGKPVMVFSNFTNNSQIPRLNNFINLLKNSETIHNNIWLMAELGAGWTSPERWGYNATNGYNGPTYGYVKADSIKSFDAFFITDISHDNYDRYYSQYSYLDYNYHYWQERMKPLGKEYIPTVEPGFDDRVNTPASDIFFIPRWKDGKAYVISSLTAGSNQYDFSNFTENPYKKWANVAKRNVGDSRIIMVYNWNDFASGRNLEPTVEFGKDYLQYTKEFFKKQ
ncbi:MAG: glycoside hydrolase family 99-like domain-containing protein [Bacteroidota bacterium]|nr:glycoside hydrolase family 99-like domain-containing protein [Bacteroidota bacterium]